MQKQYLILFVFLMLIVTPISISANQLKTVTLKGELSCGSAMCNIDDDYDIIFPVKGINIFDFCRDGDYCEIVAKVDGKTVVEIISAESDDAAQENVNLVNNSQNQTNNVANNIGLYGINLETDLQQALNAAIERGCQQVFLYKYADNVNDIKEIKGKLNHQGIEVSVLDIDEEGGSIPAAVIYENKFERIIYGYSPSECQFLKDKYNLVILPIKIWLENGAHIEAYFYKKTNDTHYLPFIFKVDMEREMLEAAINFLKEKFPGFKEIKAPFPNKLFSCGNVFCYLGDNEYMSFTSDKNVRIYQEITAEYNKYINLQQQKENEIKEQKRIQEERNRNKSLQQGM